jgi:hypothetical protein
MICIPVTLQNKYFLNTLIEKDIELERGRVCRFLIGYSDDCGNHPVGEDWKCGF